MDYKQRFKLLHYVIIMSLLAWFTLPVLASNTDVQLAEKDKALFVKAVELSKQQQWAQAEPIYRDLMARNKSWPEPANNLAVLLLKTNRIDEAKTVFEQAVNSSPAYRISQKNRTQLYSYLATQAYAKVLGEDQLKTMPEFELIQNISQNVKIIEVEKIVVQKVFIEKQVPIETPAETQADVSVYIERQLLEWANAWSESDFESYIKHYAKDFVPSDASNNYAEWRNTRRARIRFTKGVKVDVEKVRVFIEPQGEYALVEFMQSYRSNTYSDKVLKQLYMNKQQDNWLILSERTIKVF